jgi:hypothetical protein
MARLTAKEVIKLKAQIFQQVKSTINFPSIISIKRSFLDLLFKKKIKGSNAGCVLLISSRNELESIEFFSILQQLNQVVFTNGRHSSYILNKQRLSLFSINYCMFVGFSILLVILKVFLLLFFTGFKPQT